MLNNRPLTLLRYVTIILSPILMIVFTSLSKFTPQQSRLCFLLCLPIVASCIISLHAVWRQRQPSQRHRMVDAAFTLALDVIVGSVLLLASVAAWFILSVEDLINGQVGILSHDLHQWTILPLIVSFCIHYFLAFAALETGLQVDAYDDEYYCYGPSQAKGVVLLSPLQEEDGIVSEKAYLLDLEAQFSPLPPYRDSPDS